MIIAESAPSYQGQQLAVRLAQSGIEATLITDSAVFAIMSRVNKVYTSTSHLGPDHIWDHVIRILESRDCHIWNHAVLIVTVSHRTFPDQFRH